MTTDERTKELEAIVEKMTPGEWAECCDGGIWDICVLPDYETWVGSAAKEQWASQENIDGVIALKNNALDIIRTLLTERDGLKAKLEAVEGERDEAEKAVMSSYSYFNADQNESVCIQCGRSIPDYTGEKFNSIPHKPRCIVRRIQERSK